MLKRFSSWLKSSGAFGDAPDEAKPHKPLSPQHRLPQASKEELASPDPPKHNSLDVVESVEHRVIPDEVAKQVG